MMGAHVKCNYCQSEFDPPHHNSKCCSDECRSGSVKDAKSRYKKTDKGAECEARWRKSPARMVTEGRYRSKPKTKALACDRVSKYQKTEQGKITKLNVDHRRRMAVKSGRVTASEWAGKLNEHDGCCANCGTSEQIQMDHIHPLSKGGSHHIDNIQPLCGPCNSSKGAKLQWAS